MPDNINDLEFSDIGRDPRFVAGWFIAFGLVLAIVLAAVIWSLLT